MVRTGSLLGLVTHPITRTESLIHTFEVLAGLIVLSFDFDTAMIVQIIGVAVPVTKSESVTGIRNNDTDRVWFVFGKRGS